jgi:hypothetical protein
MMDPNVQKYLMDKYQLGLSDEEKAIMSDSDQRANDVALGQGMMEAANSIASGIAGRGPARPLFADNSANQSSDQVRSYILNKLNERRGAAKMEQEQAFKAKESAEKEAKADAQFAEKLKLDRDKLALDRQKIKQDHVAETNKTRNMKESAIDEMNQGRDALDLLDGVFSKVDRSQKSMGPIMGRIKSMNPYDTDSQLLRADTMKAAQIIGKYLEGGKMTDTDVIRYQKLLPAISDTPEVAVAKMNDLRNMIEKKQANRIETFNAQGYNTQGYGITPHDYALSKGGESGTAIAADNTVKIQSPDGEIRIVDKASAKKYIDKGGKVVP